MLVAKGYPLLSRAANLEAKKIGPHKIQITSKPKPNVNEKPYQCENRKGIFESMPKYFTDNYANIVETSCIHKGDDCCRYIITWDKSSLSIWTQISRIVFWSLSYRLLIILILFPGSLSIDNRAD